MGKSSHGGRLLATVALSAVLAAVPVEAQRGRRELGPATWDARLTEAEGHLVAGAFKRAFRVSEELVEEMAQLLGAGEAATRAMAIAVGYLALAEAGRGDAADAVWHWSVASSLSPELETWDLTRYGAAGELLMQREDEWRPPSAAATGDPEGEEPHAAEKIHAQSDDDVDPPKKVFSPHPQSTRALRARAVDDERVVVSYVITREGRLRKPRILQHRYPGYAFIVVETMRRWRFEPARLHGEPVATTYNLTINWTNGEVAP